MVAALSLTQGDKIEIKTTGAGVAVLEADDCVQAEMN